MSRLVPPLGPFVTALPVYIAWVLSLVTMSFVLMARVASDGAIALSDVLASPPRTLSRLEQRLKEQATLPVAALDRVGPPVLAVVDPWAPTVTVETEHGSARTSSSFKPTLMPGSIPGLAAPPHPRPARIDAETLSAPSQLPYFSSAAN